MILQLQSAAVAATQRRQLQEISFGLDAGQCLVAHGPSAARSAVADLALGLRTPQRGRALFGGTVWTDMLPAQRAAARFAIGSALDRVSWVSHLDIEDNLTLAEQMHGGRPPIEILHDATEVAARLGLAGIPDGRPHEHGADLLRALGLVRALLGRRRLLLIEDPGRLLPDATRTALVQELDRRRADGAAVLWLGGQPPTTAWSATTTVQLALQRRTLEADW